jgi:hypothetical protein
MQAVGKFIRDNSLSLAMFSLFFIFLIGLAATGFSNENEQLSEHRQAAISFGEYITSGSFIEAVFENWESEFLQMAALVVLTIWLVQKGAADSKKIKGQDAVNIKPKYSILRAKSWHERVKAFSEMLYANSLSLALISLFIISLVLHAVGGVAAANEEAVWHGEPQMSVGEYVTSSQFWFESFQNWQSEFLSVGTLLLLSIFLRQRYSPESKPVGAPNVETGE